MSATLCTQPQICERFGISDDTWRRWVKAGTAPAPVDMPGRPRWRVLDIDAYERGRFASGGRLSFPSAVRRRRRSAAA